MSINDVFGEAKLGGGSRTQWFKFPKEGGSLVLRILPAFGSLRESGRWSQYYVTHFGYRDGQGKMKPFESPEVINRQTKMVEVVDPAMERIKALRLGLERAKIDKNVEMVQKIAAELKVFNAKKSHYMNVMDLDGKIGVFAIPHKMKLALDGKIKELGQKGINPLAIQGGRYLVFTRTGSGVNTVHGVEVYRDPATDQQVVNNLTEEIARRMASEGVDLSSLYVKPTSEEVALIVKNNGGAALDQVLAKYKKPSSGGGFGGPSVTQNTQTAASLSLDEDDGLDDSELDALIGSPALVASQVQTPVTAPAATPVAQIGGNEAVKNPGDMSTDEFLKAYGLG